MAASGGLKHVAELAGVSAMTVSRALRNSHLVRAETRKRVLAAARQLDYRPDPLASRLMAAVRKGKKTRVAASLAFVRDRRDRGAAAAFHQYVELDDVRLRARMQGYSVDEFILGQGGLTMKRLQSVLAARGIDGVIFSSEACLHEMSGFAFAEFACATFGYGLQQPSLHRASTNMMQGLLAAFSWLEARGYKRIGLAVTPWVNSRSDHTYSGAMLHHQAGIPRARRVPLLIFPHDELERNRRGFHQWMKEHRPDVVVSFDRVIPEWVREDAGRIIGEDIGFLAHDWTGRADRFSGIDHNRLHVAAAAVDLVATQLFHGECGIPAVPRQVLVPASLVEGETCPPRSR